MNEVSSSVRYDEVGCFLGLSGKGKPYSIFLGFLLGVSEVLDVMTGEKLLYMVQGGLWISFKIFRMWCLSWRMAVLFRNKKSSIDLL